MAQTQIAAFMKNLTTKEMFIAISQVSSKVMLSTAENRPVVDTSIPTPNRTQPSTKNLAIFPKLKTGKKVEPELMSRLNTRQAPMQENAK